MGTTVMTDPANVRKSFFENTPSTLILNPDNQLPESNARDWPEAYKALLADAETALEMPFKSVTDKEDVPASGDKHDYMSQGIYKWPDPDKKDGLPYVYLDGVINPEIDKLDSPRLFTMAEAAETLALAGWYAGDARFLTRAADGVRHWFIHPDTRVNPNWNHAHRHPGKHDGCGIGIIESHANIKFVNAVRILDARRVMTGEEMTSLRSWFDTFADWMINSDHGKGEARMANNHSLWYFAQLVDYLIFAGRDDEAADIVSQRLPRLTEAQIEEDGKIPRELTRTLSYHYNSFALRALVMLWSQAVHLQVVDRPGMDKAAAGIRKALDWFMPYVMDKASWTYPQIKETDDRLFAWAAYRGASLVFNDKKYWNAVKEGTGVNFSGLRHHLLP